MLKLRIWTLDIKDPGFQGFLTSHGIEHQIISKASTQSGDLIEFTGSQASLAKMLDIYYDLAWEHIYYDTV